MYSNRNSTDGSSGNKRNGIQVALASAVFLGISPIFGKQAILAGFHPIAVVALRTFFAALLLFLVMLLFRRKELYIYPAGLLGCFLAGGINGLGSLLYYSALGRIDASLGQVLYLLYPLFVAMWLWFDHQPPSKLTIFRLIISLPAIYLLTRAEAGKTDLVGMLMMLGASALYALHLPINQRVLYEMPAPTVTLYTLFAMSAVVVPAYFLSNVGPLPMQSPGWNSIFYMTLVTFLSRITLFLGVKRLGGLQTALLGLGELLVTLLLAILWLEERLSIYQWIGAFILVASLLLVGFEKTASQKPSRSKGLLRWFSAHKLPPNIP